MTNIGHDPDSIFRKNKMTTKPTKEPVNETAIDWKLATVRQNCLNEAVKAIRVEYNEIIPLADKMYRFVIGEPITQIEPETSKEGWK